MSRNSSAVILGVPVPAALPAVAKALIAYWGPKGFTPDQAAPQAARFALDLSALRQQTVNGAAEYAVDTTFAVNAGASGSTDFYFAFASDTSNPPVATEFESDLSPVINIPLAVTLPAPGQPIVLPSA